MAAFLGCSSGEVGSLVCPFKVPLEVVGVSLLYFPLEQGKLLGTERIIEL